MPDVLPPEMLEHIAGRFRVLGDATRLSILSALLQSGPGAEMNVGELVERLHTSQANVSKHLRVLHDAGVVGRRREGTAAFYSVTDPSLVSLCSTVCDRLREQVRENARTFSA